MVCNLEGRLGLMAIVVQHIALRHEYITDITVLDFDRHVPDRDRQIVQLAQVAEPE
jgi:hypothetical protein